MTQGHFDLTDSVAIVTGAAMGIGFGIAQRFVEAGARVLLADLDAVALAKAVAKLPRERVEALPVDISTDEAGPRMVARCVERFGKLDVLVNNAGIYPQVPMMKMPTEVFDRVWRVNMRGLALASKAAAERFIQQGEGGAIVNISSIDSLHPSMVGLAAYDSSKGAVNMFTKSFALEMAPHRIRVNAIAPGGIATEGTQRPLQGSGMSADQMKQVMEQFTQRIPLQRLGTPDDIAYPAVFLASRAAAYVTGAILVVDGGVLLA